MVPLPVLGLSATFRIAPNCKSLTLGAARAPGLPYYDDTRDEVKLVLSSLMVEI